MKRVKVLFPIFVTSIIGAITIFQSGIASSQPTLASFLNFLPIVIRQEPPIPIPTETPEPTKTQTPTPTKTPVQGGVYILPNHFAFEDSLDYLHIVGEVMNNTDDHLTFVEIYANLYDNEGHLVGSDFTFTQLNNLPAHDRSCFHMIIHDAPANWATYQFEPVDYWTDGEPLPIMAVFDISGHYDPDFGDYQVLGQVRNDHGSRVEYVMPVGTLYDAVGIVKGCDFTFVNSTDLEPGQVSAFKMLFYGRDYSDVTSYRIQVDGNLQ